MNSRGFLYHKRLRFKDSILFLLLGLDSSLMESELKLIADWTRYGLPNLWRMHHLFSELVNGAYKGDGGWAGLDQQNRRTISGFPMLNSWTAVVFFLMPCHSQGGLLQGHQAFTHLVANKNSSAEIWKDVWGQAWWERRSNQKQKRQRCGGHETKRMMTLDLNPAKRTRYYTEHLIQSVILGLSLLMIPASRGPSGVKHYQNIGFISNNIEEYEWNGFTLAIVIYIIYSWCYLTYILLTFNFNSRLFHYNIHIHS